MSFAEIDQDNIVSVERTRKPTSIGLEYNLDVVNSRLKAQFKKWEGDLERAQGNLEDKHPHNYTDIIHVLEGDQDQVSQSLAVLCGLNPEDSSFQSVYNRVLEEHFSVTKLIKQHIQQHTKVSVSSKSIRTKSRRSSSCRTTSTVESAKIKAINAQLKLKYLELETQAKYQLDKLKIEREVEETTAIVSALSDRDNIYNHTPDACNFPEKIEYNINATSFVPANSKYDSSIIPRALPLSQPSCNIDPIIQTSQAIKGPVISCTSAVCAHNEISYPVQSSKPIVHVSVPSNIQTDQSASVSGLMTATNVNASNHPSLIPADVRTSDNTPIISNVNNVQPGTALPAPSYHNYIPQVNIARLPLPEPCIFAGDPLQFPIWINAFNALIVQSGIPAIERLYYLRRYLSGPALTCVQGFFLFNTTEAYGDAMDLLYERYGNPFVIGAAFRDKLESWPSVNIHSGISLRNFSDFLHQCLTAQRLYTSLTIWNDEREIVKIVAKLPDQLVRRWARFVRDCKLKNFRFPQFSELVKLVSEEASLACDPLTSMESINLIRKSLPSTAPRISHVRSSLHVHATGVKNYEPTCILCQDKHYLDDCKTFNSKSHADKQVYIQDHRLCYGCLKKGHMSKDCRRKLHCNICKRNHPTSLHRSMPSDKSDRVTAMNTTAVHTSDETQDSNATDIHTEQVVSHLSSSIGASKCSMILPVFVSSAENPQREHLIYALLDTQSDSSFISENTAQLLGLNGTPVNLSLSTLSDTSTLIRSEKVNTVCVRGFKSSQSSKLGSLYTRPSIPVNRSHIPTPLQASEWSHLKCLENELMTYKHIDIGLLIGFDNPQVLMPIDVIPSGTIDGPFGQKSLLGWGIIGLMKNDAFIDHDEIGVSHDTVSHEVACTIDKVKYDHHSSVVFKTSVKEVLSPSTILDILQSDFSHDRGQPEYSVEDQLFLNIVKNNIQCEDSRYVLPLPFKHNTPPSLPNNCTLAYHRLMSLKKRLSHDEQYYDSYCKFMDNLFENKHAEIINDVDPCKFAQETFQHWYIPHHGVCSASKPKLRVVFDASCKYKGTALNDHLLQGPDMTNSLLGVLLRFRKERVAVTCDVQQMFFQFKVQKDHTDYFRFLWFKDNNLNNPPSHYRMLVHIFGAISSPSIANYGLKQIAKDFSRKHGTEASDFVCNGFYVDDGLISVDTEEHAISLLKQTKALCREGSLNLHKFVSNSKSVLDELGEPNNVKTQVPGAIKALGIIWNTEHDYFQFNILLSSKPITRRSLLSIVCSIYDPLGLISPFILEGRKLLQTLCKSELGWDDPVPDDLCHRYTSWISSLLSISSIHIPRCYKPVGFGNILTAELHCFSDASLLGYGVAIYLRLIDEKGHIHCTLVLGKSRVSPIKPVTIPRLELVGALVSLRLSLVLLKSLHYDKLIPYYWTDSKIVLGYIANETKRFHTFVGNRVQEIRDNSSVSDWHYVKTSLNPADIASRGLSIKHAASNKLWFEGPHFLYLPLNVAQCDIVPVLDNDPEVKCITVLSAFVSSNLGVDRFDKFSDFCVVVRAMAACIRLKDKLLNKQTNLSIGMITRNNAKRKGEYVTCNMNQLQTGEREIIKVVQQHYFSKELKLLAAYKSNDQSDRSVARHKVVTMKPCSSLYRLNPFLDEHNMIRVGGRISNSDLSFETKHPLVLPNPKSCHVSFLLIKHFHEQVAHQGRGMTLNCIRSSGYHILGCVSAVSKYLYHCVTCRRLFKSPESQVMSNLPEDRVTASAPFLHSGVDLFGPWYVKEGRKELKRYGVVFTCLASRAVHIETVISLSTDSFINAMRRFIAIRGKVSELRSDCGTNIVGASNELKVAYDSMDFNSIKQNLLKYSCDFVKFNMHVPSASHFGGIWERQIRSIRRIMSTLLSESNCQLNDECLRTFLCEVAAIINSRPLTVESLSDVNSLTPLTPNHLITSKSELILPPPGNFTSDNMYYRNRWKKVQYLANQFWMRWRTEYLANLQARTKWNKGRRDISVGDIVIVKDSNLPRCQWLLAKVVLTFISQDSHVRSVRLLIGDPKLDIHGKRVSAVRYLERPIHKLVLLLESDK